jgi:hypothetical protein
MLFMVMHKMTPDLEKGLPPDPAIIQNMGKLIGEAREKGILHNGAGLRRSAERVRLTCSGGKCVRTEVPLQGSNELISSFVLLKVQTMDDAIAWGTRIADAVGGDVEIDVGPVVEPWHLGLVPEPKNPPLRVMAMTKANAGSESGAPPSPATVKKTDALIASMKEAGVFLAAESLGPSSRGARLKNASSKRTWTDGPFAESKEFISGFTIIRVDSLKEAMAWTERYADVLGDIEVDVREVYEA